MVPHTAQNGSDTIVLTIILPPTSKYNPPPLAASDPESPPPPVSRDSELVHFLHFPLFTPLMLLFRRRLSAEGAKPESNNRWKTGSGHVVMWICGYVLWIVQRMSHFAPGTWMARFVKYFDVKMVRRKYERIQVDLNRLLDSDYERGRRPSEFSLNMRIFSTWATRPTRPSRFSASYIFWTKLPIGKCFSLSESHIQYIIRISIVTLSIHRGTRDRCGKRPMLSPKTNTEH